MKKHFDRKTAPLLFHRLYHYVALPLTAIWLALQTFLFMAASFAEPRALPVALLFLTLTGLSAATFIGFFKWKPFSWYTALALFLFQWIYMILVAVLAHFPPLFVAFVALISAAVAVLLFLYYLKRKPLFIPVPPPFADQNLDALDEKNKSCKFCGAWLMPPDASTCPVCGAKTENA
ncbi:MAG: hypothetical protein ABFC62_03940 [Clostridiaceae bacterium]|nr:hypothetical protein [Eubacteriales bacterium]